MAQVCKLPLTHRNFSGRAKLADKVSILSLLMKWLHNTMPSLQVLWVQRGNLIPPRGWVGNRCRGRGRAGPSPQDRRRPSVGPLECPEREDDLRLP